MIELKDYSEEMLEDVRYIFHNLRPDDQRMFADSPDVEENIRLHIEKSCEMKIVYINDKPVCLFGVTERYPVLKWRYMAFHFGTDEVDRHKKSFVKIGREVIEGWLNKYGNLYMAAYSYYKKSFVMAKAFGFKFKFNVHEIYIFTKEKPQA